MKKLRLLLFADCNRKCKGCCNKDWDLKSLPKETQFYQYGEILLTGGEPMLKPDLVINTVKEIKKQNQTVKIFLYTAKVDDWIETYKVLGYLDGITVTIHEQSDVMPFLSLAYYLSMISQFAKIQKSFRVNIFKGININTDISSLWKIKDNIEWIKNSPLPKDEILKRL